MDNAKALPRWLWWDKGACVVEVVGTGHYPNSIMARLPLGTQTEIELEDLRHADQFRRQGVEG